MMSVCFSGEAGYFFSPVVLSSVSLKRASILRYAIRM